MEKRIMRCKNCNMMAQSTNEEIYSSEYCGTDNHKWRDAFRFGDFDLSDYGIKSVSLHTIETLEEKEAQDV